MESDFLEPLSSPTFKQSKRPSFLQEALWDILFPLNPPRRIQALHRCLTYKPCIGAEPGVCTAEVESCPNSGCRIRKSRWATEERKGTCCLSSEDEHASVVLQSTWGWTLGILSMQQTAWHQTVSILISIQQAT